MAVRVRVQNFQSVEDAEVVIDGLTVVTGANNSGKTALMRAIRGVFTNAPAGPLVRHGAAHLSVALTFDDGTEVKWEKGWEKPNRKGKTINRYTINGVGISNVGRGVPPEVEALGVREISASSDRIWPQIAQQFDGTLFLVNRPGSSVAEALSDVERVGKLSSALKASEKDRRQTQSELKVRRKDAEAHQADTAHYEGLDEVGVQVQSLTENKEALVGQSEKVGEAQALRDRYRGMQAKVEALEGFDPEVPDGRRLEKIAKGLAVVTAFGERHEAARKNVDVLEGFAGVSIPGGVTVNNAHASLEEAEILWASLTEARKLITDLGHEHDRLVAEQREAEKQVVVLLGDRGVCPVCETVHARGGSHEHQSRLAH